MANLRAARSALSLFLRRREAARQVTRELGMMTNRDLDDLGISRAQVRDLAREAALATR
jgi:uncharacterized protein YjiS (DUF1127 family)